MTRRRWSIAWRLAVGLSAGMAILWIGAVWIAATIMQNELNGTFDEVLRQSAFRLLPLAHELAEGDLERRGNRAEMPPVGVLGEDDEYFTYYVRDRDGAVVIRAEDALADFPIAGIPDGFSEVGGRRVFAVTDPRLGYGIVVVERTDHRSRAIATGLVALAWPLAALVPLMAFGIWYAIRLGMRPLQQLGSDIGRRDSRNLAPPEVDGQPVELAPIADAVASLLGRLGAALDAERAFAASSAHELRTPIAGALAQTQQLAIELAGKQGAARIRDIEAALKHLSQLSEKLLQLARLDAGFARADAAADLMPALRLVIRDFEASPVSAGRVRLVVPAGAALVAPINVDAFAIAVRNLVQNALIHGTAGGAVVVTVGPGAEVRIANDGPVVSPEILGRLAQPFVRGVTAASGSGLGLSIVRSILDQIGGRLVLHSPAPGHEAGFEAAITLGPFGGPSGA
ncbi:MAG: two-component sensor histidine kinase [Bauldia sp.]|nr:two-component sensor histidine kinase [Bauldia sp.]